MKSKDFQKGWTFKISQWSDQGQNIQNVKHRLPTKKRVSARKLSMNLRIYERSLRRIMKNDLGRPVYKKVIESLLFNDQKIKWEKHLQIGFEQIFENKKR